MSTEQKEKKEAASKEAKKDEKPKKDKTIKVKESEFNRLKEELAEYKDKYIRLAAEFDNARKRMDREKSEFVKYANEGFIVEFLQTLDHLELSLQAAQGENQDVKGLLMGLEMVLKNIHEQLKRYDVTPIEVKDKTFDPHAHEILEQVDSDEDEGSVLAELQKGYKLGEKVIRTTKVRVAKKKEDSQEDKKE